MLNVSVEVKVLDDVREHTGYYFRCKAGNAFQV